MLECVSLFVHPTTERTFPLSYKIKNTFQELRSQAASALVKNGFIGEESPLERKSSLMLYLGVLW